MQLPELRESLEQGTVILYEDRYPKLIKYDYTTVIATYHHDYIFERKIRPAIVASRGTDSYGNRLIVPMTSKNNPRVNLVELREWDSHGNHESSYAKLNDVKTISESEIKGVVGELSENDLARVLLGIHDMI